MKLYCATTNSGKLREFRLAAGLGWDIEPLSLKGIAAPEETGTSFEENATQKALYYGAFAPGPLFAEDSGLEVDALGGAPGIYSARFAGEHASDPANNCLLLEKLQGVQDRQARYVCAVAIAFQGQVLATFRGTMEGQILEAPQGDGGFGYDPLFYYPPFAGTLSQVATERTFEENHRRRALDQLFAWLSAAPRF
jgi:XTP/dITP diphosphohydrolase